VRLLDAPTDEEGVVMIPLVLRPFVVATMRALLPHVGPAADSGEKPRRVALEVARAAATDLAFEDADGSWFVERGFAKVAGAVEELLEHRAACGWITVGDIESAASEAARAWSRTVRLVEIARAA
jgi:hypothetical protein